MRTVEEIKKEIIAKINWEFPDWNNIARLVDEVILSEDNECEGYIVDEEFKRLRAIARGAKHEI
ncbi:hypothetical protein LCGC14_2325770 [marine sediment metagenome]|uniref:Uncharacterized protein n=1 Tax=marine sediment metagenome TaxID=412755 RepID=A0A0F9D400_9ZZZZ